MTTQFCRLEAQSICGHPHRLVSILFDHRVTWRGRAYLVDGAGPLATVPTSVDATLQNKLAAAANRIKSNK